MGHKTKVLNLMLKHRDKAKIKLLWDLLKLQVSES